MADRMDRIDERLTHLERALRIANDNLTLIITELREQGREISILSSRIERLHCRRPTSQTHPTVATCSHK